MISYVALLCKANKKVEKIRQSLGNRQNTLYVFFKMLIKLWVRLRLIQTDLKALSFIREADVFLFYVRFSYFVSKLQNSDCLVHNYSDSH